MDYSVYDPGNHGDIDSWRQLSPSPSTPGDCLHFFLPFFKGSFVQLLVVLLVVAILFQSLKRGQMAQSRGPWDF